MLLSYYLIIKFFIFYLFYSHNFFQNYHIYIYIYIYISFIIKCMHLFLSYAFILMHLFLFILILYILVSGRNMHKGLISLYSSITNEIFKILFTKRKLIRYYYFINIYMLYQNATFIFIKFIFFSFSVIQFYRVLIYGFNFF